MVRGDFEGTTFYNIYIAVSVLPKKRPRTNMTFYLLTLFLYANVFIYLLTTTTMNIRWFDTGEGRGPW